MLLKRDFNQTLNETRQLELDRLKKENEKLEKVQKQGLDQVKVLTAIKTFLMKKPSRNLVKYNDVTTEILHEILESEILTDTTNIQIKRLTKNELNSSPDHPSPCPLTRSRRKTKAMRVQA